MSDQDGHPGLDEGRIPENPHTVTAKLPDMAAARGLVEELEQHGIPPGSISLSGYVPPEGDGAVHDMPESEAFVDVTRSTVGGGVIGLLVGGALGALLTLIFPNLALGWAIALGAIFGGGIGLAAGGMAVVKYNSPAWRETYETAEKDETVSVGVHDDDREVVASAEQLMRRHSPLEIRGLDEDGR